MRRCRIAVLPIAMALVFMVCLAHADVPRIISYQGRLTETDGTPLVGEFTLTLRLYDAPAGGKRIWKEEHEIVLNERDNGIFSVSLGSRAPFDSDMSFNEPHWLSIEVNGEEEFVPRQRLTAVGYAINADELDGLDSSQFLGIAALGDNAPAAVAAKAKAGEAAQVARGDHAHEGVHSIGASGQAQLSGDITLSAGSNVALTQSDRDIEISSGGSNHASVSAASPVEIDYESDTELLLATITKSQDSSAVLVIASVQLNNTKGGKRATTLKLFRGSTQLEGSYTVRHDSKNNPAGEIPVTLHALDSKSATGELTFALKARADSDGVEAAVRRLTLLEL